MSIIHHLNIMRKAFGHGTLFPKIRHKQKSAPQGSTEAPTHGFILERCSKEVSWFRHSEHHIYLKDWPSYHILQLSDLHIRSKDKWLETLCLHLQGLKPDIIVLTGDLVTKNWTAEALEYFLEQLPTSKLGCFAILGNWEYWVVSDHQEWRNTLEKYGVQLLVEESVELEHLTIVGTDDHLSGSCDPQFLRSQLCDKPTLCLTHSPEVFPQLAHAPIDIVLAGHAHGGQVSLPLLGPVWVPHGTGGFIGGWYKQNQTHLFVSRGLGWSVAPLRLFCSPEIVSIFTAGNTDRL
jgi:uncharacterized protein